jgi:hypothetical protein
VSFWVTLIRDSFRAGLSLIQPLDCLEGHMEAHALNVTLGSIHGRP